MGFREVLPWLIFLGCLCGRIHAADPLVDLLESKGFKPHFQAGDPIEVGGLLEPSEEKYGTVFGETIRRGIMTPSEQTETVAIEPMLVFSNPQEVAHQFPAVAKWASAADPKAKVRFRAIVVRAVSLRPEIKILKPQELREKIASEIGVSTEELEGHVIVVGIASPVAEMVKARLTDADREFIGALNGSVIGYRAGIPMPSYNAVGTAEILQVLHVFELEGLAKKRTIHLNGLEFLPAGGVVGWIDRIRAGWKTEESLADDSFRWFPDGEIHGFDLWPGRFYFRRRQGTRVDTRVIDLTLANDGQSLIVNFDK